MDLLANMRKDYQLQKLSEGSVNENPFQQFSIWWNETAEAKLEEANAMVLATASADGTPAARIVLMKAFNENGFVFFSNYNSNKGKQLQENASACLVFFWKELERQVIIEGEIKKVSEQESDEYFATRPMESRIGAWSSPQSKVIQNREILEKNVSYFTNKYQSQNIPRPPHWGGYILIPTLIEFWQGGAGRLHDRLQYSIDTTNSWIIKRLAP